MSKKPKFHDRSVDDDNFLHCLKLVASCVTWAKTLPINHNVQWNDLNMIHLPAEMLLAFVRLHARETDELGVACKAALDDLAVWQSVGKRSRRAPHGERG